MNATLMLNIVKARFWVLIVVPLVAAASAYMVTMSKPVLYSANARVLIDYRTPLEGELAGEVLPVGLQESYVTTQLGIISSRRVAEKVIENMNLADDPDWQAAFAESQRSGQEFTSWAVGALLESLTVTIGDDSRLVDIWYTDTDPGFAASAANAFAEAYRDTNRELEHTPAKQSAESVQPLLTELKAKLENAERNLSTYQQRTGIVATDEQLDLESTHLKELADQRLESETKVSAAESRLDALETLVKDGKATDVVPELLRNELIQRMKIEVSAKETDLAEKSITLGKNHPDRRRVEAEVATLRSRLTQETSKVLDGIRLELLELRETAERARQSEAAQKEKVLSLKHDRDGLQPLLREVESARASYELSLRMYSEYDIHGHLNRTNVSLMDMAEPPLLPSSTDIVTSMATALIGGMLLALGLIFVWETLDRRIRNRDDLVDISNETYLGELPHAGS